MKEIERDEHLPRCTSRAHGNEVPTAGRAVVLAFQGLLLVSAFCGVPAAAQPAVAHQSASAPMSLSVQRLKEEYLRCDRASSRQRLPSQAAIYCSTVSEELLQREFAGDFDRLLAWWREQRPVPVSE